VTESKAIDGSAFTYIPSPRGIAMLEDLFKQRFLAAIDACMVACNVETKAAKQRDFLFAFEQCPFNGTQLFADEVVMAPNEGKLLGNALSMQSVFDHLWRLDRFPRYVHLFIDSFSDDEVRFIVQASCCYSSIYDPEHRIEFFPIQVRGFRRSMP
jgi:hypothetical protein